MQIPFKYNLRSLKERPGATTLTTIGIGLTVSIAVLIAGLLTGLKRSFDTNGDPSNIVVLHKGVTSEFMSSVTKDNFQVIKSLEGVARLPDGEPMASGEIFVGVLLPRRDGSGEVNVTMRGLGPAGIVLRPKVKIVDGRWFNPGQREVVVGRSVHQRFDADLKQQVFFGHGNWTVVGIFEDNGGAQESEIWADSNQVGADAGRAYYSSVLLKADSPSTSSELLRKIEADQRLGMTAVREPEYYAQQTEAGRSLKFVGLFIVVVMGFGSCFAAANTMFAAIAYRSREIALLRFLGFTRGQILSSFLLESSLLAVLGGILGILAMLPFNGFTAGTMNGYTFTEMIFKMQITPSVAALALGIAVLMGIFGGLIPAWSASRQAVALKLRD